MGAAGGEGTLRLIFLDFALEKSLFPFHVSGGRWAERERRPPNHQPLAVAARARSSQTKWQKFASLEFRRAQVSKPEV